MTDYLEAKTPSGTKTAPRPPADIETSRQRKVAKARHLWFIFTVPNVQTTQEGSLTKLEDQPDVLVEASGGEGSTPSEELLRVPVALDEEVILHGETLKHVSRFLRSARIPASAPSELSAEEWMAQVRAWASSFPQRDYVIDDSRESIYGDRL